MSPLASGADAAETGEGWLPRLGPEFEDSEWTRPRTKAGTMRGQVRTELALGALGAHTGLGLWIEKRASPRIDSNGMSVALRGGVGFRTRLASGAPTAFLPMMGAVRMYGGSKKHGDFSGFYFTFETRLRAERAPFEVYGIDEDTDLGRVTTRNIYLEFGYGLGGDFGLVDFDVLPVLAPGNGDGELAGLGITARLGASFADPGRGR